MTIPNTPEGRRNRLDHLLNKLLYAEESVGYHQREAVKTRQEIEELLDGLEHLASEAKEEPTPHWLESATLERYRCRCGKEFPEQAEFYEHIDATKEPEPDPHGLAWEKSTATAVRCFCGAEYPDTAEFYGHLGAMKESEPCRYEAGDGHP